MFKFKSTNDELSLDELDRVTAGVPKLGEERPIQAFNHDKLSLDELDRVTAGVPKLGEERPIQAFDPDELSLDDLDRVTAGVPFMPNINGDLPKGVTIAENGEIIREERSR